MLDKLCTGTLIPTPMPSFSPAQDATIETPSNGLTPQGSAVAQPPQLTALDDEPNESDGSSTP